MTKLSALKGLYIFLIAALLAGALPVGTAFVGSPAAEAAATWSTPVNISHTPGGDKTMIPRNSTDNKDRALAVWEDRYRGAASQILGNDSVAGWKSSADQLTPANTGTREASIATNGSNYSVAAWQDYDAGGGACNVFAKTRTSAGAWSSNAVQVSHAVGSAKAQSPSLAAGPNGDFYAVWMQGANDGDMRIYFARSSDNGNSWTNPVPLPAAAGAKWPKIAVTTNNKVVVAWMQGRLQIYATQFVNGTWKAPLNISNASIVAHDVCLAADANGNVHAVWDEAGSSGSDLDVIYRKWDGATNSWKPKRNITNYPDSNNVQARNASVAASQSGEVVIAWSDDNGRGTANFQIKYARGTVDGAGQFHATAAGPAFGNPPYLEKNPWLSGGTGSAHMTFRSNRDDPNMDIEYSKLSLVPPLESSVTAPSGWANTTSFTVTWAGTAPNGVAAYRVQVGTGPQGSITWTNWQTDVITTSATFDAAAFDGGGNGDTYYFRSRVQDQTTGDWEAWPITPAWDKKVTIDTDNPSGDFQIGNGSGATQSGIVKLTLNYTDTLSGVGTIWVSNSGADNKWKAYAAPAGKTTTSVSWNLKDPAYGGTSANNVLKTVYVKYWDRARNGSDVVTHTIFLDKLAPTGAMHINDDAASTNQITVTVNLTATDNSGLPVKQYRFGRMVNGVPVWSIGWSNFPVSGTLSFDYLLPSGADGPKTLVAKFKDQAGNLSSNYKATITLNTAPAQVSPANGSPISGTVTLNWDPVPAAAKYQVQVKTPAGTILTSPAVTGSTQYQVPGSWLKLGKTYQWRVRTYVYGRWGLFSPWWSFNYS